MTADTLAILIVAAAYLNIGMQYVIACQKVKAGLPFWFEVVVIVLWPPIIVVGSWLKRRKEK